MELFHCRARRRFARGLKRKPMALIKRLRKAKKEAPPLEKPEVTCFCVLNINGVFIQDIRNKLWTSSYKLFLN